MLRLRGTFSYRCHPPSYMKSERLPRANVPFATMVEQSRVPPVFLPEMPTQGWSADWGGSLCYPKSFQTIFIGTRQQLARCSSTPFGPREIFVQSCETCSSYLKRPRRLPKHVQRSTVPAPKISHHPDHHHPYPFYPSYISQSLHLLRFPCIFPTKSFLLHPF